MRKSLPTLTDLIRRLEEHRHAGVDAIEFAVDELLAVLRWNNIREGHGNGRAKSLKDVMEIIEVLGPEESETALHLVLKAARIRQNAEEVEAWLASVTNTGERT